jgi:hypothetical protein
LYDGASTLDIGLTGAEHTRNDGYKYSYANYLNEAGQAAGYAERYNGGSTYLGRSAWFYDDDLNQTFEAPELSVRTDGYAYSRIQYLGDDGLALGYYELYSGMTYMGSRALAFTVADGWQELGLLVDGGLAFNGWQYLANAYYANGAGQILGNGLRTTQTGGALSYLLTPITEVVPEPSTVWLMALGGLVPLARRFNRK